MAWRQLKRGGPFDSEPLIRYNEVMEVGRRLQFNRGVIVLLFCAAAVLSANADFRVASYNVQNYLNHPAGTRPAKSTAARDKVRDSIVAARADVIALQEVGEPEAFAELRASLQSVGVAYPYWEYITGYDTNIHVAVLSRLPIVARRPHTNDSFLLFGRRYRVARGFAEVEIQVNSRYRFTLFTGHLKSKREVGYADQGELRAEEAAVLRKKIETHLARDPQGNLVVLGDFNDNKDTPTLRTIIGRGKRGLIDTRPAERNGDSAPASRPRTDPRRVVWTHFYEKEDTFSRLDYILLSPGMAREWSPQDTFIVTLPDWGSGSDHRPIVATFHDVDH